IAFTDGHRVGEAVAMAWSLETLLRTARNQDMLGYLEQAIARLHGGDPETTDVLLELHVVRLACLLRLRRTDQFQANWLGSQTRRATELQGARLGPCGPPRSLQPARELDASPGSL